MKKNIAFLHDKFPMGGAERITIDTAEYLSAYNYHVSVFTRVLNADRLKNESCSVVQLPDKSRIKSTCNIEFIIDYAKQNNISVLVFVSYVPFLKYLKSRLPGCRIVFINHGAPMWEVTNKEYSKARQRENGNRIWAQMKWYAFDYFKYKVFRSYEKAILSLYKNTYQLSDRYVVLCNSYAEQVSNLLSLDKKTSKLRVIYNLEKTISDVNYKKKKQVIFVGRLSYADKRVDRLLDIWGMLCKDVHDWELLIIGDGVERSNLELKAQEMGLQGVTFVGHTNHVDEYYKDASILCLTSTFEGWPLCLTEAHANGVIPIAFDSTAGIVELLSPDNMGYLVPSFDLEQYAKTLRYMIDHPQQLDLMRPLVVEKSKKYSIENIGPLWLQLFEELLNP